MTSRPILEGLISVTLPVGHRLSNVIRVVLTWFLARLAISLWAEGNEQTVCHRIKDS